ncbi:TIGR04283 family arsenosugar biosynthesis glycosyltransferase [Desulfomonile tiedjei]|uniref:TIGR04283 family arsenosugar biosynthesis glycosyltransferase n=1 Tax=Desulfomonile tiedjei TaxID=2358 RepID=UPI0002D60FC2|nr:TIGR04283 family arsenosugar biosynthesis glycosyltransferase [Desulfomonile tiedjei]
MIIPTLNEAEYLPRTLERLANKEDLDIIVADGGSTDGTREIARSFTVTFMECPKGRALQMNSAVRSASGTVLLFLHADTLLPDNWEKEVCNVLSHNTVCGGAFSLRIRGNGIGLRIVEALADFRSKAFSLPYGDQAIFVKREIFDDLGGFAEIPIMEDFEFMRRLRMRGKIRILPDSVITSGRRWEKLGVLQTTMINQMMIMGYYLGVAPESLEKFYRKPR